METVNAITQRINGVDDRLDAASQLKSVTIDDFRAGQQALSNRIDAVQALVKQVQETAKDAAQQGATMEEVVVMGARIEELQVKLQDLRAAKAASAQVTAASKPKATAPSRKATAQAKAKAAEVPPPFSVVGVEYRGGERFLSVAPPGSTQLSQLNLIRPGDMVAGSNWQLNSLDDSRALFSINGSTRILPLRP
ncbi:Methyl-accepting chemotaxis protein [Pseudomonas savastanoi pv. phaseolicola]|nr:Methyl-accepting chemotaxis protein [Pseudomonas savastanoi pv. phaseolicola]